MIDQDDINALYLQTACEMIDFINRFYKGTVLFTVIIALI